MQIILVRHGAAEDLDPEGAAQDQDRQLTRKGRKQMKQVAKGLRRLVDRVDCVATSPYVRAVQTAEIVARAFKTEQPRLEVVDALRSGTGADVKTEWLGGQDPDASIALIGHEPDLSELMGYLTTSSGFSYAKFSKAGVCMIHCPTAPAAASGTLLWLLTPAMFKWIGV